MSTCNCDGTVSADIQDYFLGDSLLKSLGIDETAFGIGGAADPRPGACEDAVGQLRAGAQDPCNLDSPGDLAVLYASLVPLHWNVIKGTPFQNPVQKAADVAAGTGSSTAPVISISSPKMSSGSNMIFLAGAIIILGVGLILVFR